MPFPAPPGLSAVSFPAGKFSARDGETETRALLAAVRQGCDHAARRLVETMYPNVIRIVRAHLPGHCDQEDVAQEVFLRIFSRLDSYRGLSPFSHWVSRITTNACLDLMRRRKARPEIRFCDLSSGEEALLLAAAGAEAETEAALPGESAVFVDKLLDSLKPDQQLVVRLMDVEQHSISEIRQLTGWSASKIKMTALRARRKLAEVIGRLGNSILP
ncbi:MAG: RNA polymerase sigma factor [Verrucomicrobiota bacterium]